MKYLVYVQLILVVAFNTANNASAQGPVFALEWGSNGTGDGQFDAPFDVAVGPGGVVYVVDTNNHRVQKFDANGNFITKWGTGGTLGEGRFNFPASIAVGQDGSVYVADTDNHRVQKFDSNGTFLLEWGSVCNLHTGVGCVGDGTGQFLRPFGIAVSPTNEVFVADTNNERIQKFDAAGAYLLQWGARGSFPGQFASSRSVATSTGTVYVLDRGNHRVQKFGEDGTLVGVWGSEGPNPGQIDNALGLTVDQLGRVFIVDTDRVQLFDSDGVFILSWGTTGSGPGEFLNPHGVAVAVDGSIYVADTVNDRIQKFIELPVAVENQSWSRTKSLYR